MFSGDDLLLTGIGPCITHSLHVVGDSGLLNLEPIVMLSWELPFGLVFVGVVEENLESGCLFL